MQKIELDWSVTREKVDEALRRIIAVADPLQVIAFGSRARGDHRPDSDLDLAVIFANDDEKLRRRLPYSVFRGVDMTIDLLVASSATYDLYKPWRNSVWNKIAAEGVLLYDREHPERARPDALYAGEGGRVDSQSSAA